MLIPWKVPLLAVMIYRQRSHGDVFRSHDLVAVIGPTRNS